MDKRFASFIRSAANGIAAAGDPRQYNLLKSSIYQVPVVSIREFIESDYYLGQSVSGLHKNLIEELEIVFDKDSGITEWILGGSVGWGKTTSATIGMIYSLYRLTCLKDPASFFGLLPGSKIVFGIFNITLTRSDTTYESIKLWTDISPYFQEYCSRQIRPGDPIKYPSKNLQVVQGSLKDHALGESLFSVMIDEANFFKLAKGRAMSNLDRTRVHDIYKTVKRREMSRFMKFGIVPGVNMLISSQEEARTSFLDERMKRADKDKSIHVTIKSLWETKAEEDFSGEKFQVVVGTERFPSQLLEQDEIPPKGAEVLDVPVEYMTLFEEDTDDAVRDIAGRATTRKGRFFSLTERLDWCVDPTRRHPFAKEVLQDISIDRPDLGIADFLDEKVLFRTSHSKSMLRVDPGALRAVHCDLGVTGDPAAIVIGHLTPDLGILYYDLMLKIVPPIIGEIDIQAVMEFLKVLRGLGMRFCSATYDQFQSRQSIQQLNRAKFKASRFSVGLADYQTLRRRIYGGPTICSYYQYKPFLKELVELEKGEGPEDKPDHPPGGTNDLVEGAAAVASILLARTKERPGTQRVNYLERARMMLPMVGNRPMEPRL